MAGPSALQRRPLLLAAAASAGVLAGRQLDALGLLPGVVESADVRAAALAPKFTVLTVVGAALIAVTAEALLRRGRPRRAATLLVVGQTGLLAVPELLAEAAGKPAGAATGSDAAELAKLAAAVGLQVVVAALAVAVAVVVDAVLVHLPTPLPHVRVPDLIRPVPGPPGVPTGRFVGGIRGRGPPVPVMP